MSTTRRASALPACSTRWARGRPTDEQGAVGAALARRGMETGCVIYTSFDNIRRPLWADAGSSAREALAQELTLAFETASRVGSSHIAVLSGIDPRGNAKAQRAAFVDNFALGRRAGREGRRRAAAGVGRQRARLPDMLLHHITDAREIAAAVGSPAVRLIFDTGHVQAMDGDIVRHLEAAWDQIAIVQAGRHAGAGSNRAAVRSTSPPCWVC